MGGDLHDPYTTEVCRTDYKIQDSQGGEALGLGRYCTDAALDLFRAGFCCYLPV